MTGTAVLIMLAAIIIIWGGLAVSVTALISRGRREDRDAREPEGVGDGRRDASQALTLGMGAAIQAHNIPPGMQDPKEGRNNAAMLQSAAFRKRTRTTRSAGVGHPLPGIVVPLT